MTTIGIDARITDREGAELSGIGRYTVEISRALARCRPDWDIAVFSNRRDLFPSLDPETTRWPTAASLGRIAWLHAGSGLARAARRCDLWFGTSFILPLWWRRPAVVTIHDLTFALMPSRYRGRVNALYAGWATRRSAASAGRILCGSHETRELLERVWQVDPAKIRVIPYGVSRVFSEIPDTSSGADMSPPYFIFVGTFEARKGLDTLYDAWRSAREGLPDCRLVLAGRPGWGTSDLLARFVEDESVRVIFSPDDSTLAELYRGAIALVYPSRMEGFGFPVHEAMAAGTAVIATDLACIREVAGEVPVYVPVGDAHALADALRDLKPSGEDRDARVRAGRRLAEGLDWDTVGERHARVLEEALPGQRDMPPDRCAGPSAR